MACFVFTNITGCYDSVYKRRNSTEKFLMSSVSPDGNYYLKAYRTEPGATVDFSIKVYIVEDSREKQIYNRYHESSVTITWIDNSTVQINNISLDLSKQQTYDWQKNN